MFGSMYFAILIAASAMMLLLAVYSLQQKTNGSILFAALIVVAAGWPINTAISMVVPQGQAGLFYETIR